MGDRPAALELGGSVSRFCAQRFLRLLIDKRVAEPTCEADGITLIQNVQGVADFVGLPADTVPADDASFLDGSTLVVPWPITLLIARAACTRYPSEILAEYNLRDATLRPQNIPGNRHPQISAVDAGTAIF